MIAGVMGELLAVLMLTVSSLLLMPKDYCCNVWGEIVGGREKMGRMAGEITESMKLYHEE